MTGRGFALLLVGIVGFVAFFGLVGFTGVQSRQSEERVAVACVQAGGTWDGETESCEAAP